MERGVGTGAISEAWVTDVGAAAPSEVYSMGASTENSLSYAGNETIDQCPTVCYLLPSHPFVQQATVTFSTTFSHLKNGTRLTYRSIQLRQQ